MKGIADLIQLSNGQWIDPLSVRAVVISTKYWVEIIIGGRIVSAGLFKSQEEAEAARDRLAACFNAHRSKARER